MEQYPLHHTDKEPTINDLMKYSESDIARQALTRYFFARNPEKAVKRHERLSTPIIRRVVIETVGRAIPRYEGWGNYRLDRSKRPIDAAMRFAVSGSVFNEIVHTVVAGQNIMTVAANVMSSVEAHQTLLTTNVGMGIGALTLNTALVALQRYNRARMLTRVNEQLAEGDSSEYGDKNWTGVDYRAASAFDAAQRHASSH